MSTPIIQFVHLENLLAEAAGADALRVHVEERVDVKNSAALTHKTISIGLCVRAIAPVRQILSWHYQVDTVSFYMQGRAEDGHFPNGRSSEQERYETAWEQAEKMKDELVTVLCDDEYTVHTDGIITLNSSKREIFPLLRGITEIVSLPTAREKTKEKF